MANEKEVKAQVRLRFWNVNRQRMTATRNLQVTVKKAGGLTMKTLEGILAKTDVDGGEGKVDHLSRAQVISLKTVSAKHYFNQMLRNGRGSTVVARRVQGHPGKRHLLSSGRVKLAVVGARGAEEEVR